jgi:hypothetical protein
MWQRENERRFNNQEQLVDTDDVVFSRPGLLGNNTDSSNAHTVKLHRNYNGSGQSAFGGADEWPVLTAHFSFPVGSENKRNELATQIMALADKLLSE